MTSPILPSLTPQQVESFRRDGVICLRGQIAPQWIDLLRNGLDRSRRSPGEFVWTYTDEADGRHFHNENRRWHQIDEYRRFIFESPVAGVVGQLMGWSQADLLFDSAFYRSAGTNTRTPWHQDLPYLCVDGEDALCSAWVPLHPVARDSALECVVGSHLWNKRFFRLNFDPAGSKAHQTGDRETEWDEMPDIDAHRDDYAIVGYAMEPGDCLIIHGLLVHGSAGNLDENQDLAVVTTRLLGDNAVYRPDKPGGVQPDLSKYADACHLKPGDRVTSELFPRVWSA